MGPGLLASGSSPCGFVAATTLSIPASPESCGAWSGEAGSVRGARAPQPATATKATSDPQTARTNTTAPHAPPGRRPGSRHQNKCASPPEIAPPPEDFAWCAEEDGVPRGPLSGDAVSMLLRCRTSPPFVFAAILAAGCGRSVTPPAPKASFADESDRGRSSVTRTTSVTLWSTSSLEGEPTPHDDACPDGMTLIEGEYCP